jgi:acylphosphatase
MEKKAIHAIIKGRVQGVFFRDNALAKASEQAICGWVRNNADGTVEVQAAGMSEALDAFTNWLRQGPPLARVDDVMCESIAPEIVTQNHFVITD